MRERRQRKFKLQRLLSWVGAFLVVVVLALLIIMLIAKLPQKQTLRSATSLAEQHAHFHDVQKTYKANLKRPYYTVVGKNQANQPAYAIVSSDFKHIRVMKQTDGITAENASAIAQRRVAGDVTNAGLLIYRKQPTWVVTLQSKHQVHYVLVNFKTGKVIKTLNL
ncbi:DUF5590 domain-containing protein [Fructilactobacillus ixorae]|uniref:DUF5590 domain-containing protein n=1 Tax=Fructilactobacillus ixorae TaxID=1750535 RepID=A0ABY5C1S8_9LACO|nr:DUF5590 domain-containing protein [Fructilactobacillus ixorae]USS92705.1 DUF5590 domain-containing protein [Fructilactobacillus ixorae]